MSYAARKLKPAVAQPPTDQPKLRITHAAGDDAPLIDASSSDAGPLAEIAPSPAGVEPKRAAPAPLAGSSAHDAESAAAAARPEPLLTLRRATPMDFEPLCFFFDTALRRDYFLRRGQLREMLDSPHHGVFVAEVDAVLVGVAITTRRCRLVNALVHPNFRGLGIGRALVDYCGATEVRAKLDMSTGDPRAFYRALGFQSVARTGPKRNIELMRIVPVPPPTHCSQSSGTQSRSHGTSTQGRSNGSGAQSGTPNGSHGSGTRRSNTRGAKAKRRVRPSTHRTARGQ